MVEIQESFARQGPCLWVCSTPIGNLSDASLRLLEVLRAADVIAAEDTRQTRKLLSHYEIHGKALVSYHQHNQAARRQDLIRWWDEGKTVALVSDAGTPLVSDPGEDAVALAIERGVPVIPVPGASAVLAALAASGCCSQPFTFVGFLPRSGRELEAVLADIAALPGSVVCYEAPHRLLTTLRRLAEVVPGRRVAIAKELTKRYETFIRGEIEAVIEYLSQQPIRGEYVIILDAIRRLGEPAAEGGDPSGADRPSSATGDAALYSVSGGDAQSRWSAALARVRELMAVGYSHKQAVREAAQIHGIRRHDLYQATLATDRGDSDEDSLEASGPGTDRD
jgi:16S rRNA (cytidine1402-2'-O)-methyltransferase